jgi:hypothetical protein
MIEPALIVVLLGAIKIALADLDIEALGDVVDLPPGSIVDYYRVQISKPPALIVSLLAAAVSSNPTWSAGTAPSSPAPAASDAKALVSTSSMTASDYAQCVSELAGKKVVFEQPGEVTRQGWCGTPRPR